MIADCELYRAVEDMAAEPSITHFRECVIAYRAAYRL